MVTILIVVLWYYFWRLQGITNKPAIYLAVILNDM